MCFFGLTLILFTPEYYDGAGGVISSLFNDFNFHYCMIQLKEQTNLDKGKTISSVLPLIATGLNYIVYSFPQIDPYIVNDDFVNMRLFSRQFRDTHRIMYGVVYTPQYFRELHVLFVNYEDLLRLQAQLSTAFGEMMVYYMQ